jgi:succinate dehydrogenase / fumarate reductase membrane anchor subunit
MENVLSDRPAQKKTTQSDLAGTLWLVQAISGKLLVLLLGLHMIAHHFIVEGGLRTFQDVIDYVSNPIIFALEVAFLLIVTPHAMLGLRAIILDLKPSEGARKAADWILAIVGIAAIGYGIYLAVALQQV